VSGSSEPGAIGIGRRESNQVKLSEPVLNNRELAALLLIAALLAGASLIRPVRSSLGKVAKAFFAPKLLLSLLAMLAYVGLLIGLGLKTGVWNWDLASETATWFVGSAFVLFLNQADASRQSGFFWRVVLQMLGITLLIDFFMNDLFVLRLPAELVLQVIVTFLVLLSLVAAQDAAHRPVKRIADLLVSLIVLGLAGFILIQVVRQWNQVTTRSNLLELLLPVWLTLALLPFIYLSSILVAYESAFNRIEGALVDSSHGSWKAKLALVSVLRERRVDASRFAGGWAKEAAAAPSFRAARRVAREFKASVRKREADEQEARDRLGRYIGVQGTDADGRQLDRREFEETTKALRWLAISQMGWYRNHGGRYHDDLLQLLAPHFIADGLPANHGIGMDVSHDGQAWFAWRRTVTGWCFAIGASMPPPDQWEFDGPDPPRGFPRVDVAWGRAPFTMDANPNW
jgi:hypothetical protein